MKAMINIEGNKKNVETYTICVLQLMKEWKNESSEVKLKILDGLVHIGSVPISIANNVLTHKDIV